MSNSVASQNMAPNGTNKNDWHRADIVAAVKKKGTTLAALSRDQGWHSRTLNNALDRHWPKGECVIAMAIGVTPDEIWPTRYVNEAAQ
ncbi:helix-turn-helix domain-containing protein [Serratia sp. (in: enterobacteria)]|uniref:helix-turn-helix domain-containing protein n=1 Tax=Serratia sp. (in: enterobacteria) TaxID=616 RepID=UPI0039894280